MGILCVFCVYDTIGNRCFEKTSFPKIFDIDMLIIALDKDWRQLGTGPLVEPLTPLETFNLVAIL